VALSGIAELVLAGLVPSVASVAVTVLLPALLSVTGREACPSTSALLAGRSALVSDEVMATESMALVIKFQLASTALTVTLKARPAVADAGGPTLPVALPGDALSPGARI